MDINNIIQAILVILTMASGYFIARKNILGMIFALLSQPFWVYTSYKNKQWGILLLSIYYIIIYIYGLGGWLKDPNVDKPNCIKNIKVRIKNFIKNIKQYWSLNKSYKNN